MSTEENKAIAHRFVEEALNNKADPDPLFADTLTFHFPGAPGPLDKQGWNESFAPFAVAFPDLHTTIDDLIAEGDRVVARLTSRGTQQADFQGIAATGRTVTFTSMSIWRIEGGKIVEHWLTFDSLGVLQQLGAIPTPEPAGV